ncbi:A serine protease triad forms the catalytic Centre of A triacylglycerol lipase [Endogone sp. FLAS-F59071]|nr:A serine protease triad forms the catalytic Centre of A triacylglycerol lipase [Endogone sp. FLAS-F59071]|eukprot:RUS13440.1 A serine protease triad forms the catalytic Centre of A triacylglycerol lipase [Endogone sp. FLAS-F59071]
MNIKHMRLVLGMLCILLASTFASSRTYVPATEIPVFESFATLSAISYCDLNGWTCGSYCDEFPNMIVVTTFSTDITRTTGYVARDDLNKAIYVSYRGTFYLQNNLFDVLFELVPYLPVTGAMVHQGFYSSFNEVIDLVYGNVSQQLANYPDYKVVVLGHSLGAAVALLSTLDLHQRLQSLNVSNLFLYTFGEPRVGNPTFAQYATELGFPTVRLINQNDIYPVLPPRALGYEHEGTEYWIEDAQGNTVICPQLEDPTCSDSVRLVQRNLTVHFHYYK